MKKTAKFFEGTLDFKNFCKMKNDYKLKGTTRTIYKSLIKEVDTKKGDLLKMNVFIIKGSGFLWH